MIARGAPAWQLVLADLALILFLVTLAALARSSASAERPVSPSPQIAPSQALFRPSESGPDLSQWLAEQPRDKRATLTVIARHNGSNRAEVWERARMLSESAEEADIAARIVITRGDTSDLYASLAYDNPGTEK